MNDFNAALFAHFDRLRGWLRLPDYRPALRPYSIDWFYEYFYSRGIDDQMIREAECFPLTPFPEKAERDRYTQIMHAPRLPDRPYPILEGIGFPFLTATEPFGQVRGVRYAPHYVEYWKQRGKPPPRYLSPKKGRAANSTHLYCLPCDYQALLKQGTVACLTEGPAKTIKLAQDVRSLNTSIETYAAIGFMGVDCILQSPELHKIAWRNRVVYLFFDADSARKEGVARAELALYAYLMSKGARCVKSCIWPEERGKGYDDYCLNAGRKLGLEPRDVLNRLIDKAKTPIQKYAPLDDDHRTGYPVKFVCESLARYPYLPKPAAAEIAGELSKYYKCVGFKPAEIKEALAESIKQSLAEQTQKKMDANADLVKQMFNVGYTPRMPENFLIEDGFLKHVDKPLCKGLVISKHVQNQSAISAYQVSFCDGKTATIEADDLTSYRNLAGLFNRRGELLYDASAKLIQGYLSQFWHLNREHIRPAQLFTRTGWDHDTFRLPQLAENNGHDVLYADRLLQRYQARGDASAERQFYRELLLEQHAGIMLLVGLAAPFVQILKIDNYVVFIHGLGGKGKSMAAKLALMWLGDPHDLMYTMNFTGLGKELVLSQDFDLPVVMDELNTANAEGKEIAKFIIESIYGFHSGKGRGRGNVKITLRDINEYRGLLLMTSERSLESVVENLKNVSIGGAFRRTLQIHAGKIPLWNFVNDSESVGFSRIAKNITANCGHFCQMWLPHISQPDVQTRVQRAYEHYLGFGASYDLRGTEHLLALLLAIMPEVEILLDLPYNSIYEAQKDFLVNITKVQKETIDYHLKDITPRFAERLRGFMLQNARCFDGLCSDSLDLTAIFGKIRMNGKKVDVAMPGNVVKQFMNEAGFSTGDLESLEAENVLLNRAQSVRVREKAIKMYLFQFEQDEIGIEIDDAEDQKESANKKRN